MISRSRVGILFFLIDFKEPITLLLNSSLQRFLYSKFFNLS
ncbi:hypothetical protein LEP1GSC059_4558 [Leptospira noguchii serovar Panama str. CZ214]|uniref:Uncharacterized protein n=1 Tax=Leptospira noguchii serovar Panama str. CZ214 TaxID=1001595 RepID=T0GNZ9_9LEPT|nr:hypothetical protein LEP1GSC059_4558 [Leptospira noguchii serovar Panama str. CZ214]